MDWRERGKRGGSLGLFGGWVFGFGVLEGEGGGEGFFLADFR